MFSLLITSLINFPLHPKKKKQFSFSFHQHRQQAPTLPLCPLPSQKTRKTGASLPLALFQCDQTLKTPHLLSIFQEQPKKKQKWTNKMKTETPSSTSLPPGAITNTFLTFSTKDPLSTFLTSLDQLLSSVQPKEITKRSSRSSSNKELMFCPPTTLS
jgi:hypothetical protein